MSDAVPSTRPPECEASRAAPPPGCPPCIGRYRVERVLGEGSFGVVYLARDEDLQRAVAIKVPTARLLARPGAVDAFLREARIVASLRHEHIVRVFDLGRTDVGACYIVSEYVAGGSLADLLQKRRPSVGEAAALVADVAEALHHAHQHHLVHRDVKPGNILLDAAGQACLADFGIALRDEDFGSGSGLAGTPWYMSPEQARGESHRVDGRADIYSLGAVLYELLAGQVPFRRDDVRDLLRDIASLTLEARPPRQLVSDLPRELERICLKALAKRAAERYPTAHDFADDLRALLAQQPPLPAVPAAVPATAAAPSPATPDSRSAFDSTGESTPEECLARVVPKGLRAFDAEDRDFFLGLLPGPRDRHGLPDSVRFWKRRVETTEAEQTFAVGLLYGPSGCGKSSLVRAGLLPRLGRDVVAIYVEAAAGQTEGRLLRGLARHCPGLDSSRSLAEAVAALRRGEGLPAGAKVLLVLDQFEQYLQAHAQEGDTDLVRALRQCDGVRAQAMLLVRDDFGLAVAHFLAGLEINLLQGHNMALADLFDLVHARKVLAAFGHAYGRLADDPGRWSREQQAFLDQAVAGLARDGRVVPVRLALFAEMVKGKPWAPATLREVGGTEGVGVAFLEESLAAPSANPRHRLHQLAVRGVLRSLLPEQGTNIKGAMRSASELEMASGYAGRPKQFADLLHLLDSELRLVTPTDPEEAAEDLAVGAGGPHLPAPTAASRYYQLTHDYLVPTVRDWLTRKQKETRRGRAELCLAERAALWEVKRENRHLPTWWEGLNIRLFTRKRDWTAPQRRMMRRAFGYHSAGAAIVGLALAAVLAGAIGLLFLQDARTERLKGIRKASEDDGQRGLREFENGRFSSAIDRFSNGLGQIQGEPGFEELRERLTQRRAHAEQLRKFYRLADETDLAAPVHLLHGSQDLEFYHLADEPKALAACDESLKVLGVRYVAGWEDRLPATDLGAPEVDRLREEVYKQMLFLVLLHAYENLQGEKPTNLQQVIDTERPLFECVESYRPSFATSALKHAVRVVTNQRVDPDEADTLRPKNALDFYLSGIFHHWFSKHPPNAVMHIIIEAARGSEWPVIDKADETAERHLRQAIALHPDRYWAYYWLAVTLAERGKYEDAELASTSCLGLRSDYPAAYVVRAVVRKKMAQSATDPSQSRAFYDRALADLAVAIKHPFFELSASRAQANVYVARGDWFQCLDENEKARADYSAAIALDDWHKVLSEDVRRRIMKRVGRTR